MATFFFESPQLIQWCTSSQVTDPHKKVADFRNFMNVYMYACIYLHTRETHIERHMSLSGI